MRWRKRAEVSFWVKRVWSGVSFEVGGGAVGGRRAEDLGDGEGEWCVVVEFRFCFLVLWASVLGGGEELVAGWGLGDLRALSIWEGVFSFWEFATGTSCVDKSSP